MGLILIADAGSTKTDWCLLDTSSGSLLSQVQTEGINPSIYSHKRITDSIEALTPIFIKYQIEEIYFYGAGCLAQDNKDFIRHILDDSFHPEIISVESDMTGACKALFADNSGIACILGTGSNSCIYEEGKIKRQIPSLGYILGDEGSGVALGKKLLNGIFKLQFSDLIIEKFKEKYELEVPELIRKVYKEPMPGRFIASFTTFLNENIEEPEIESLVVEEFDDFFLKNILPYRSNLSIGFIGSVAHFFSQQLNSVAHKYNFKIEKILKNPMEGLVTYIGGK